MKDTITFALLLTAVLLAIITVFLPVSGGSSEPDRGTRLATTRQEIRHIEPVTVVGHRGALADESLASAQPGRSDPSAAMPSHLPER